MIASGRRLSTRASLAFVVLAMGLLGMLFAYVSGEAYSKLVLESERATLSDHLRSETNKLHEDFELRTRALAQLAGSDTNFSKAAIARSLAGQSAASLPVSVRQLDNLFQYSLASVGDIRFSRLYFLDDKLAVVASSSIGDSSLTNPPCYALLARMAQITERSRSTNRLCFVDERPYDVSIAPLMHERGGYLYAVGELVPGLASIEHLLGAPLRLKGAAGAVLYQSSDWPAPDKLASRLIIDYTLYTSAPRAIPLELTLARDLTGFYERLSGLRSLLLLGIAIATAVAMVLALFSLERSLLSPLRGLIAQMQRIRENQRNPELSPVPSGNADITLLIQGFSDITARLRESYENAERMAFTDALTNLPNRSLFLDRLRQAILGAKRDTKPFALLIMDLDHFKDINDTLGHQLGDTLLTHVAQRLRSKLRASDTVARMGGDEFAVLLPAADAKHAGMASRMLLQALRAPFTVDEHNLSVSASIGIALYPENGVDASVLMQRADVAMYAAKASGNGFEFYNPAVDQNYPTRLTLLSDLRQAVEHEQFELYYQPIVDLTTSKVSGIEALARWRHPRDGILLPDRFIPLLEQSGLIRGLMPWVVSEALKRVHLLKLAGYPLSISVNLSMRDLQDPNIAESFAEQLAAHGVEAGSVVLEITESTVMTDAERTLELLLKLSRMGLKIAIDDFGTGYSSLTYLKKLPVSTLKIDRSFVSGMTSEENDAAIVRTSIELAHNLGLQVVAEGVETETVLNQLKALGCDRAQGHFIGRPLTQTELLEWLAQSAWGFGPAATTTRGPIRLIS